MFITSYWWRPYLFDKTIDDIYSFIIQDMWKAAYQAFIMNNRKEKLTLYTDLGGMQYLQFLPYYDIKEIDYPTEYLYFLPSTQKWDTIQRATTGSVYFDLGTVIWDVKECNKVAGESSAFSVLDYTNKVYNRKLKTQLKGFNIDDLQGIVNTYNTSIVKFSDYNTKMQVTNAMFELNKKLNGLGVKVTDLLQYKNGLDTLMFNGFFSYKDTPTLLAQKYSLYSVTSGWCFLKKERIEELKQQVKMWDSKLYAKLEECEKHLRGEDIEELKKEYSKFLPFDGTSQEEDQQ